MGSSLPYLERCPRNRRRQGASGELTHDPEKMTNVPQGFDFSFLNEDEARKILQVLERNEELQRAEKDRIRYKAAAFSFPWTCVQRRPGRGEGARGWGHLSGVLRRAASPPPPPARTGRRNLQWGLPLRTRGAWLEVLLHSAFQKGSVPRGGERPCPRPAGASSGALLAQWVQHSRPASAGTRGRDPPLGVPAERLARLPPVSQSRDGGSGRRVGWDEGAAWSGTLARAPRGLAALLAQRALGRRNALPRPTQTVSEAREG